MMVTLCYHFPMNTFVDDVLDACRQSGQAYCKFLSPNDTGKTRSHQAGTYIKKDFGRQWIPPEKGRNIELDVMVRWIVPHQERLVTTSRLKWYGAGTRSEHRLTRFGQGFPFRDINYTGSLMVMVPTGGSTFDIFLVENDDQIETVLSGLLLSPTALDNGAIWTAARPQEYSNIFIRDFLSTLHGEFPDTTTMAKKGRELAAATISQSTTWDERLIGWIATEYQLYRAVEDFFLQQQITAISNTDGFLSLANSVMNRRKSRAGKSLEHHIAAMLTEAAVPFSSQARTEHKNKADFILPSVSAYHNPQFPADALVFLAAKTTARDRWRQILPEAERIAEKHLLTLQQSLSEDQLHQIAGAHVALVVPQRYHAKYPATGNIWTVDAFIQWLRERRDTQWVML